jgi:predicted glycosyltransferase involved in capsule biosynthesis
MNNNIDILITTFEKRYDLLVKLIESIRRCNDSNIILLLNGEIEKEISETYKKNILQLCLNTTNIIPYFFTEFVGLSKLWNRGIIASNKKYQLILNDDLLFNKNIFEDIELNQINDILTINNSFSHFIINKKFLQEFGYFNEYLLGIGFEDSDFVRRYKKLYSKDVPTLYNNSIGHSRSTIMTDNIDNLFRDKYSIYNREIYDNLNLMYINPYPLEKYYSDNKNKIVQIKS